MRKIWAVIVVLLGLLPGAAQAGFIFEDYTFDLELTPHEKNWLESHRVLRAGVMVDAPPYEFIYNGRYEGIASSYLKIIENNTGIKFEIIPVDDMETALRKLGEGEVDLLPLAARNAYTVKKADFSKAYVASSLGIFSNKNTVFVNNLDDIVRQKVAVSNELRSFFKQLQEREHNFVFYDTALEALQAANRGEADFVVSDILYAKYAIENMQMKNLRYIAPVVGSSYGFGMAVRADEQVLLRIINKVLFKLDPAVHSEIRQKWSNIDYDADELIIQRYLRYLYVSFVVFMLLLGAVMYRNRQQQRIAEQKSQSQKMESIGRLAGGVAHDFNNMLAGIHGAAELLEMNIEPDSGLRKYTDMIISACERASRLTSQLLVFSRKKERTQENMNLHDCIRESLYLLELGLSKKIVIKQNLRAARHYVCGNNDLLQNLILNLGFNAKDAMPSGGEIKVETRNVTLSADDVNACLIKVREGDYIELRICDSGSGIPENIRNKIFEPFFTTKDVGKGTGMGLAAVYGILQEHKGTLKLKSMPGNTEFRIYLPVVAVRGTCKPAERRRSSIKAKVLVVDDEKILLELMKEILKAGGSEVTAVSDSGKAAEVYRAGEFDVVMLDVLMPGKSGVEVYQELKEINPEVKVIFMSGYSKDNDIEKIIAENPEVEFIGKPYKTLEIVEKIAKVLGTRQEA